MGQFIVADQDDQFLTGIDIDERYGTPVEIPRVEHDLVRVHPPLAEILLEERLPLVEVLLKIDVGRDLVPGRLIDQPPGAEQT